MLKNIHRSVDIQIFIELYGSTSKKDTKTANKLQFSIDILRIRTKHNFQLSKLKLKLLLFQVSPKYQ